MQVPAAIKAALLDPAFASRARRPLGQTLGIIQMVFAVGLLVQFAWVGINAVSAGILLVVLAIGLAASFLDGVLEQVEIQDAQSETPSSVL